MKLLFQVWMWGVAVFFLIILVMGLIGPIGN